MLDVLLAYPYLDKKTRDSVVRAQRAGHIRFILDSGAFTAWRQGSVIELDDYCRFIEGLEEPPWRYFTLDVVGDPEGTWKNYETMLKRGFKPVPIFTRGDDPAMIDRYYETSDLVAIGGLVGTPRNRGFVKGIMTVVGDRKVHWLGFTVFDFLRIYRPYSADSSTWSMSIRFGVLDLWDPNFARMVRVSRKDFVKRPSDAVARLMAFYGEKVESLSHSSQWRNIKRNNGTTAMRRLTYRSSIRMAKDITEKLGVNMFIAYAHASEIRFALEAVEDLQC